MTQSEKIIRALEEIHNPDGAHHKQFVIDQVLRCLTGCELIQKTAVDCNEKPYTYMAYGESAEYLEWVREYKETGAEWDIGVAP
jgi:hypothetical protein